MNLYLGQIAAILRLELKKTLLSRRGWWVYLLALGPVALMLLHWTVEGARRGGRHSIGEDTLVYAGIFHFFYLRLGIFFGCMGVFSNLFRGEMLEKTLHYYFMTPVRREVLVIGKYLSGLIVASILFSGSAALAFLMIGRHAGVEWSNYLSPGPG